MGFEQIDELQTDVGASTKQRSPRLDRHSTSSSAEADAPEPTHAHRS
jgi:hypothetical protein